MTLNGLQSPDFLRSFGTGLLAALALCIALAVWAVMSADGLRREQLDALPAETVLIMPGDTLRPADIPDSHAEHPAAHDESPHAEADHHKDKAHHEQTDHHEDIPHEAAAAHDAHSEEAHMPRAKGPPFESYSVAFTPPAGKKLLSVVIAPLGLSSALTQAALSDLPPFTTVVFSPYSGTLQQQIDAARKSQKEVWLQLPLEKTAPAENDTGPLSLRSEYMTQQNRDILEQLIGAGYGYAGLLARDMDETTLNMNSPRNLDILKDIETNGLGFAYVSETPQDYLKGAFPSGHLHHIPFSSDAPFSRIEPVLNDLLKTGRSLTIILRPYPAQMQALSSWLNTLPENNYALAPLSAQMR
jgi:hypothetical protein